MFIEQWAFYLSRRASPHFVITGSSLKRVGCCNRLPIKNWGMNIQNLKIKSSNMKPAANTARAAGAMHLYTGQCFLQ